MSLPDGAPTRVIGRYAIHEEIASGGTATVYLGSLLGAAGFARTVAIKRLHAHLAREPELVSRFLEEARIAARIRHPNVVAVLDVVDADGEFFLVMEYVAGESLARLARAARDCDERIPPPIAAAVIVGALRGLHAAHEATDERGQPLRIVHRDVSPQNILVGRDGVAHVLDFGVAKAAGQRRGGHGRIQGKASYMPPEQARGEDVTRAVDIYAAGVVLWELLTGEPLFAGENEAHVLERVLFGKVAPPSSRGAAAELDEVVMRALSRSPGERFPTARDMARAIEAVAQVAGASEVSDWLESQSGARLQDRHAGGAAIPPGPPSPSAPAGPAAGEARRERRRAIAVAVGVAVLGSGALLAARPVRTVPLAASAAPPPRPPTSSEVPASVAAIASTAPVAPAPATTSPPRRSHPALEVGASSGSRIVRDVPAWTPGKRPKAASAECNPPYTVDADGVKQYKVPCL